MSPEQLNNRAGPTAGYSGTAVDVWAAGVWLTVMLVNSQDPERGGVGCYL